jgi:hypothetical protein
MTARKRSPDTDFLRMTRDLPEVLALETMSVKDLTEKYAEVFGEPTRSRNRVYLVRAISWRIQERAYGGLSASTIAAIAQVAEEAPRPWRRRLMDRGTRPLPVLPKPTPKPEPLPRAPRDPRLPPPGTVLRRVYRGEAHEVRVHAEDFEYRGKRYTSLSTVARTITGTAWNGFAFFAVGKQEEARA